MVLACSLLDTYLMEDVCDQLEHRARLHRTMIEVQQLLGSGTPAMRRLQSKAFQPHAALAAPYRFQACQVWPKDGGQHLLEGPILDDATSLYPDIVDWMLC